MSILFPLLITIVAIGWAFLNSSLPPRTEDIWLRLAAQRLVLANWALSLIISLSAWLVWSILR